MLVKDNNKIHYTEPVYFHTPPRFKQRPYVYKEENLFSNKETRKSLTVDLQT